MTNPETWADIVQFTREFPDTEHWNRWRSTICPVIEEALRQGYDRLFRAGSSMHHLIFSTLKHHGLRMEPRITLRVTDDWKIGIYYSTGHIDFVAPIQSVVAAAPEAFAIFTRYLMRLWEDTVPEPIPERLRKK